MGVMLMVAVAGCSSEPEEEPEQPADEPEVEEVAEEEEEPQLSELFGLPLPPEYRNIRHDDRQARVTTYMGLDELEEFFDGEVVDYEVVRDGRQVRVMPLRSGAARAQAYRFGGPRSHVVVEYRQPVSSDHPVHQRPPLSDAEEEGEDSAEETERIEPSGPPTGRAVGGELPVAPTAGTPEWLDDVAGEPVELKTADGEPLAPGAVWGEPYTPPEGTLLHQERFRHNFGRPFGDWRAY